MANSRVPNRLTITFLLLLGMMGWFSADALSQTAREKNSRAKNTAKVTEAEPVSARDAARDGKPASAPGLQRFDSRWYHVYHNLTPGEAKMFSTHMDAVFEEYSQRFSSLSNVAPKAMPLYLFRTQADYEAFLNKLGLVGTNTGGMFFVTRVEEGLATFVAERPITQTFAVLQHEGFHQFAFRYIGPSLPVWINEGLAQYFEDGVLVGNKLYLGLANATRIAAVKIALANNKQFEFDRLINMSNDEWGRNVVEGKPEAALQYDQSWSIAFFLIAADGGKYRPAVGKYRPAFEKYLQLVAKRKPSSEAFAEAFGTTDTAAFKRRWAEFARALEPDAINSAIAKLEFLGQGLKYLSKQKSPMPTSVADLRSRLQHIQFSTVTVRSNVKTTNHSKDETLYAFDSGDGKSTQFKLVKPDNAGLPPRIVAPGLKPEPTLVWYVDGTGDLVMDVAFR